LSAAAPDAAEAPVADFAPTTATTNEDGKLKRFVKSATFNAADGATCSVLVKEGDAVVAAGQLQPLRFHKRFGHRHEHHRHGGFRKGVRDASNAQSSDPGGGCDKCD
jgi:hypothetical protein